MSFIVLTKSSFLISQLHMVHSTETTWACTREARTETHTEEISILYSLYRRKFYKIKYLNKMHGNENLLSVPWECFKMMFFCHFC